MAKLFGKIEDTDLADLPQVVKDALVAADAEKVATDARIAALEDKLNATNPPNKDDTSPTNSSAPVTAESMMYDTRSDIILMRMRESDDKLTAMAVKMFETEIRADLAKSSPQLRADETYITNLVNLAKGRHMSEVLDAVRKQDAASPYASLFTEGSGGNPPAPPVNDPVKLLTDEHKRAADRMGISHADYAANLKEFGAI